MLELWQAGAGAVRPPRRPAGVLQRLLQQDAWSLVLGSEVATPCAPAQGVSLFLMVPATRALVLYSFGAVCYNVERRDN